MSDFKSFSDNDLTMILQWSCIRWYFELRKSPLKSHSMLNVVPRNTTCLTV